MAGRSSGAVRRGVFLVLMMGLPAAGFGQIVINEIMQNPSAVLDSAGEWFELYNAGTAEVDLVGWVIKDDGSNTHTLATANGTTTIAAGGYLVLGINGNSSENGGVTVDYDYPSNWSLGNSDDEVVLENDAGVEQDRVAYDNGATFPDPNGASMALRATDLDNNVGDNWCTSPTEWSGSAGDEGTPGAANDCPEQGPPEFTGEIHEIQGNGAASPYIGSIATTNDNAVTAVAA